MNKKYLVLLFFFLLMNHNTPQSVFNGVVTVENQLLQENNLTTQNLTLNGIVTINNNLENNSLLFSGNNITILGLTEYLFSKAFSLDNDGTLFTTPLNAIEKTFLINDTYSSLYTNVISPLDQDILSINTVKNNTEIGALLDIRNITFNSNDIFLNAQNIDTTNINHIIPVNENLNIKTLLTTPSLAINTADSINELEAINLNVNNTATISSNDMLMNTKEASCNKIKSDKITILSNTITLEENIPFQFVLQKNINLSNIVILGLNNKNELIQFPDFYFPVVFIMGSIDAKLITINIKKNIEFIDASSITFFSLGTIDPIDNKSTCEIKKKITIDTIELGASDTQPLLIKSNTIATTLDTNTSSTANPSFKTADITNLTIQNNLITNGKIYFIGFKNLNNLSIINGGIKIVADSNQEWLIGTEPGSSAAFKENIHDFHLSKEEFLAAIEPVYKSTKEEFFVSLDLKKIEISPLCSLAIEYNNEGEPLYYDHRGILAIAASQISHLQEEITDYEEFSEQIEKQRISLENTQRENEKEFQQSKEEIILLLKELHSQYSKRT